MRETGNHADPLMFGFGIMFSIVRACRTPYVECEQILNPLFGFCEASYSPGGHPGCVVGAPVEHGLILFCLSLSRTVEQKQRNASAAAVLWCSACVGVSRTQPNIALQAEQIVQGTSSSRGSGGCMSISARHPTWGAVGQAARALRRGGQQGLYYAIGSTGRSAGSRLRTPDLRPQTQAFARGFRFTFLVAMTRGSWGGTARRSA
jgi:hypothetical protein